jgi:hypothetical protein
MQAGAEDSCGRRRWRQARNHMNENITHSGTWALAVIMILVAAWFLYRYLAPKSWREWAGSSRAPSRSRLQRNERDFGARSRI